MRITVMKSYWGMMTRLVMLGGCPVMTIFEQMTVIEQYLFASALYYGQIQSCRYLFGKTDIFASFSKASGFIVYFLMIWQIFILFIYFFFQIWKLGKELWFQFSTCLCGSQQFSRYIGSLIALTTQTDTSQVEICALDADWYHGFALTWHSSRLYPYLALLICFTRISSNQSNKLL